MKRIKKDQNFSIILFLTAFKKSNKEENKVGHKSLQWNKKFIMMIAK